MLELIDMSREAIDMRNKKMSKAAARIYNAAFKKDQVKKTKTDTTTVYTKDHKPYEIFVKHDYDKLWPVEAYEMEYHTVAECERVIKSLREMIDEQQKYIFKLIDQITKPTALRAKVTENFELEMEREKRKIRAAMPVSDHWRRLRDSDYWKLVDKEDGSPFTEKEWKQLWSS